MARGRNTKQARTIRHAELLAEYGARSDEELSAILDATEQRLREIRTSTAEAKAIALQIEFARNDLRDTEVRLNQAREAGWGFLRLRRDPSAVSRQSEADAAVWAVRQKLAALHAKKDAAEKVAADRYLWEANKLGDVATAVHAIRQSRRRELERARLNALEGRARSGARKYRNADNVPEFCPYCNNKITEPHHDHIVPVARGGLSESTNLVFICKSCNQAKRDSTLLQFCRRKGLDFHQVVSRLEALGKVV